MEKDVKFKKKEIMKYTRINGYRLLFTTSFLFLIICATFYFLGIHFTSQSALIFSTFLFIVILTSILLGVILIEMFVLHVRLKYTDDQANTVYNELAKIRVKGK